jgi:hypothetical protein
LLCYDQNIFVSKETEHGNLFFQPTGDTGYRIFIKLHEKGKPSERVGRKATGLSPELSGYGSRAAVLKQHLERGCALRGRIFKKRCCYEQTKPKISVTHKPISLPMGRHNGGRGTGYFYFPGPGVRSGPDPSLGCQ